MVYYNDNELIIRNMEEDLCTSVRKEREEKCKKYFRINGKTGKIKISKKLQKGTYKLKVKVKAAGSHNYGPSVKKAVFKIKIQ